MLIVKINWTMPGFSVTYRVFGAIKMIAALWAPPDISKFFKLFSNFHVTVLSNQEEPA